MDRYMKIVFTVIAIALVSLAVKDVNLLPIAEAQQGWEWEQETELGINAALPEANGFGYICASYYVPRSTNSETTRYVSASFYSEPNCKGTFMASGSLYGEGTTHKNAHSYYLYDVATLLYFANSLDRAAETGQRVRYFRCSSVKTMCMRSVQFRGDPNEVAD